MSVQMRWLSFAIGVGLGTIISFVWKVPPLWLLVLSAFPLLVIELRRLGPDEMPGWFDGGFPGWSDGA